MNSLWKPKPKKVKLVPKKYPEPSQIKENSIVKKVWFMGKVYLRRLN